MILPTLILALFLAKEPVQSAQLQFDAGNYKAALITLRAAHPRSTNKAEIHFWIARSNFELHENDEAVNHFETAVKLDPNKAEYYRWLGRAYGAKAEADHSILFARKVKQAFETAVRLEPGNIAARRDLMQFFVEAPWVVGGDKGKARKQIEAITAIDPLQGRLARAAYLAADKQRKAAEAEYLSIVMLQPQDINAYMEAADFFEDRKNVKGLEKTVEAASHVNRDDPRLCFFRGVALVIRRANLAEAEKLLKTYISAVPEKSDYPSHQTALEWLGKIGK